MARSSKSNNLPLTPEILRAAYEYFCVTVPFCKWNMPDADEILFKVTRSRKVLGQARYFTGQKKPNYELEVSEHFIGRTHSLMELVAHEMVHIHQRETRMEKGGEHNAAFKKLAAVVCKHHGFDPKLF